MGKRGTLIALGPKQMGHAMLSAIARDIDAGVDTAVLDQLRINVLGCTARMQLMRSASRPQCNCGIVYQTTTRRCAGLRSNAPMTSSTVCDVSARLHGRDKATAGNIAAAYAKLRIARVGKRSATTSSAPR